MIAYLDTNVVFWLCEGRIGNLSGAATDAVNNHDLLVSPMVLIELAYLREIGRSLRQPQDILKQLEMQLSLHVCRHAFEDVAAMAIFESWTRDPFDRIIVAQAKANRYSPLITSDEKIRENYKNAIW